MASRVPSVRAHLCPHFTPVEPRFVVPPSRPQQVRLQKRGRDHWIDATLHPNGRVEHALLPADTRVLGLDPDMLLWFRKREGHVAEGDRLRSVAEYAGFYEADPPEDEPHVPDLPEPDFSQYVREMMLDEMRLSRSMECSEEAYD